MTGNRINTEELFNEALDDGRRRNYDSALKKLKKVLSVTDRIPVALLYLGRTHHELGNYEDAVVSFRLFITKMPKSGPGYFYLGRTYIAMQKFDRAVNCFSESIKLKDDFAPALAYLGYSLMRCGSTVKSVDYLSRAVELDPENRRIFSMYINSILMYSLKEFRNENYSGALEGFFFIERAGFNSITTKLYTGIALKELRRYEEAFGYIREASELEPEDDLIKNILAELYIHLSQVEDAVALLGSYKNDEQVISFLEGIDEIERDLAVSYWNKKEYGPALHFALASLKKKRTAEMHLLAGECHKYRERYENAFNHFERAEKLAPAALEPLYGKATVSWLRKDYVSMLEILSAIKKKDPDDSFADYYRILCAAETDAPYSEWKDKLDEMLKKEEDPWLFHAQGRGELFGNNSDRAASAFRKAISLNDNIREAWIGLLKSIEGRKAAARLPVFKKYLDKFTDDTETRSLYADLLMQTEKYSAAAEQFKILSTASNADSGILKKYAHCCRKAGNYSEAAMLYRQILSSDPYNEQYLKLLLYCMRMDGKDGDTIPLLRRAVREFKKPSIDLLLVFGSTLYRNGMDEEALAVFQNCIYRGHNDWRVYRNMGIIYKNKGIKEWAEMYLKKADKLKKN